MPRLFLQSQKPANLPLADRQRHIDAGHVLLALLCLVLLAVMLTHGGLQLKSDGSNYFAYLRSAVFDGDLDFHNEFSRFDRAFWSTYKPKDTVTGHYTNVFSVGPAILWAPFYLAGHLVVLLANLLGAGLKADGFGWPYYLAVNTASLLYSFAGIILTYRLGRRYYGQWPALGAAALVWLASFLTYYTVYQPYMSHAVSFFTAALFIFYWESTRPERTLIQWTLLGLTAGLMMLVRWQNGLLMIIPALEALALYWAAFNSRSWRRAGATIKANTIFLLAAVVGFMPQMAAWQVVYGSFLTIPQGSGFLHWGAPFWSEILFSSRHGLYAWTPFVYLSTLGLFMFYKRDRLFAIGGAAAFGLMTYVNSIISDWWAGWGFGMRRYDSLLILFALGLAAVLARLQKAAPRAAAGLGAALLIAFTGFNWLLMAKLDGGSIHPGGPVAFNRVFNISDDSFYRYTGYPFSIPANWVFAAKYGLSPARYDTLAGGFIDDPYFYGDTIKPGPGSPLLGQGWSTPVEYQGKDCRNVQSKAVVYAPIRTVTDFALEISWASAVPTDMDILLNGQLIKRARLGPELEKHTLTLSKNSLHAGLNTIELAVSGGSGSAAVEYLRFTRLEKISDWK